MYKTIIRSVVQCGSEAWCLTADDEKNLRIWERKVLRKIFGPICVAGYWRSRKNEEVRQLYGELDIVTEIKKRKIEMAGAYGEDEWGKGGKEVISEHCRRKWECRKTKVKVDG